MSAIMMPSTFDASIKEMLIEAQLQAVAALAAKYGFDKDEAIRELNLGEIKLVRKRGPVAKSEEKPVTKKVKKEAKEAKVDKDGNPKAKRGPTGYLLYAADVRPTVRARLTDALEEGTKLKPQDVVRAIAVDWKALHAGRRAEWNAKAQTPVVSEVESEPEPEVESEPEPEVEIEIEEFDLVEE
jgi:hypothetical protein